MSLALQLTLGTVLLILCTLVHVGMVAFSIPWFRKVAALVENRKAPVRHAAVLCFGLTAIVVAHTIEIWCWAAAFFALRAFRVSKAVSISPRSPIRRLAMAIWF